MPVQFFAIPLGIAIDVRKNIPVATKCSIIFAKTFIRSTFPVQPTMSGIPIIPVLQSYLL